jgi:tyrosyl-tRNA synthetase
MNLFDEYRWRGMLQDATEGADEALAAGPLTAYIGFDPTAASLHVGTLVPIMGLVHLQRAGHHPIILCGGGTGLIGDPSGKTDERKLLTKEEAEANVAGIRAQLEHFLDFETSVNPARTLNNLEWLGEISMIDFLRDVGKHFSVNAMMKKESVRRRLEEEEQGISYTEFSYALLQAYDFLALNERYGCTLQMGGSDQWGNITAGIDLIRRVRGERAYGITYPLITNASGAKFGKSEEGNVWLDSELTSPYRFYQFWLNGDDRDAGSYLRHFSLRSREEIEALEQELAERPHQRAAQRALAEELTERLHGTTGLEKARQATGVLFGGSIEGLGADEIAEVFADVPSHGVARESLSGGTSFVDLLAESGLASSKGDARRAIEGGGMYLNNARVESVDAVVTVEDAVEGRFLVLRKGKKSYMLVQLEG